MTICTGAVDHKLHHWSFRLTEAAEEGIAMHHDCHILYIIPKDFAGA